MAPGPPWIVLPTYEEAASLPGVLEGIARALPQAHVLVVDDGSPDGTGALAARLGAEVLSRPGKLGLGSAYRAGFARALTGGAGLVVEMDADGSHDPADLPGLIAPVAGGEADLVVGSRYVAGGGVDAWTRPRRALSRGGCAYARAVLRVPVRDLTSGFKCFGAGTLEAIGYAGVDSVGYCFQVELTYRALLAGLRVRELPIRFGERTAGRSKMDARIALEAAWRIPRMRTLGVRHSAADDQEDEGQR